MKTHPELNPYHPVHINAVARLTNSIQILGGVDAAICKATEMPSVYRTPPDWRITVHTKIDGGDQRPMISAMVDEWLTTDQAFADNASIGGMLEIDVYAPGAHDIIDVHIKFPQHPPKDD